MNTINRLVIGLPKREVRSRKKYLHNNGQKFSKLDENNEPTDLRSSKNLKAFYKLFQTCDEDKILMQPEVKKKKKKDTA